MKKIIFGTHNEHKLFEVKKIFPKNIELLSLSDVNLLEDIPETKQTIEGNAEQKADYIYKKTKTDVFADDTGLEIEELNMKPGVLSARYAGNNKNSDANMKKVLEKLGNKTNRKARFRTVICLIMNGEKYFFEGKIEGNILSKSQGKEGFGYDPIFMPNGYNISFAEMPIEIKNKISHRANAIKKLSDFLKDFDHETNLV